MSGLRYPPPPLTEAHAARIPTSLLLLDLMAHLNTCNGACEYCKPKLAEIDRRIPVRDPLYVNAEQGT
jgi:hypothetical protein